jgi:hypothetical protein
MITRDIPMLFQTEMVQSIERNQKKCTRRLKGLDVVNEKPYEWEFRLIYFDLEKKLVAIFKKENSTETIHIKCPYGTPGDLIWVRETVSYFVQSGGSIQREKTKYKADERWTNNKLVKWKPAIHMPKIFTRFWLEITYIKIERLHHIFEQDAIDEGVYSFDNFNVVSGKIRYKDYLDNNNSIGYVDAMSSFESLWIKINGTESWKKNPWVWVIGFKRVEKERSII